MDIFAEQGYNKYLTDRISRELENEAKGLPRDHGLEPELHHWDFKFVQKTHQPDREPFNLDKTPPPTSSRVSKSDGSHPPTDNPNPI